MRIRAQGCQGSRPVLLKHSLGEVLEIYLMADSDPRRYIKALEGLHAPFKELIPRAIPLELHLQIKFERVGLARKVNLYQWSITGSGTSGSMIENFPFEPRLIASPQDSQRDSGKVLEQHSCDDKRISAVRSAEGCHDAKVVMSDSWIFFPS